MPGHAEDSRLHYRVLGPLAVSRGDVSLQVPAGRQRVVLAMLLFEANRIVSIERLIDAVWETDPPATARVQIQICVSSLRRFLQLPGQPETILTRPPGYLLRLAASQLDVLRFDQLVAEAHRAVEAGEKATAVALFRTALAQFRGPVADGVPSEVVRASATRLTERRLQVVESCVDLELSLGKHRELVGELRDLVAANPLQERLLGFLVIALHRSGRTSEALQAYRDGRRRLVDELGLEPGAELRALEQRILAEEDDVDPATAAGQPDTTTVTQLVPRQLPMDIADFTGRADQLRHIDVLVDGSTEVMPIVVVTGAGGVGKSVLAVHIAQRLQTGSFPDGQLYADLHGTGNPAASSAVLSRFLRSLGVPGAAVPEDLAERADLYRTLLADRRVLVVLDDASDEGQVLPLLPGSAACVVLVTSRSRLTGLPGARLVELEQMDTDTGIDLLSRLVGPARVAAERDAATQLVAAVGGLPLALRILGARLAARSHWSLSAMVTRLLDERRRLDELTYGDLGVRASLALTVDPLPERARTLLRRLAGMDNTVFGEWYAAAVLDTSIADGVSVLETLVDAQLVDFAGEDPAGNPRYRCHELVRVYARERLAAEEDEATRLDTVRRVLGCWLFLFDEAHRREYGGDFTRLRGDAPRWSLDAGYVATMLAVPLSWLDHVRADALAAMRQAAECGLAEECWDLTVGAVTLFESRSYFDDWWESHEQALIAVRRAGSAMGEAAVLCSLASLQITRQEVALSRASLERALELFEGLDCALGRALVLRNQATLDRIDGDPDAAMDRYRLALAAFEEAGDRVGVAHVLNNIAQTHILRGEPDTAEALLNRSLVICREVGSHRVEAQVCYHLGVVALSQDRLREAEASLRAALEIVRAHGDRVGEWRALAKIGVVQARLGDPGAGSESLLAAIEVCERTGDQMGGAEVRLDLAEQLHALGASDAAEEAVVLALAVLTRSCTEQLTDRAARLLAMIRAGTAISLR
ncbi:AfsR/SARP family transcriptional regulator [Lentzea xinjiangensis]|uniref:AfsR/SARP family transcriptional regulator n=1 Tax=Lentzea xinjiangensis TaxID=402600 RepID=UPI001160B8C5|nr:BTAD domain-containing putative transcriptional regulator [Lentzea xinjiangensis]